jgi:hypothetical protein
MLFPALDSSDIEELGRCFDGTVFPLGYVCMKEQGAQTIKLLPLLVL